MICYNLLLMLLPNSLVMVVCIYCDSYSDPHISLNILLVIIYEGSLTPTRSGIRSGSNELCNCSNG
ncbi:hypothetical protein Hdeb2414_s0025g00663611 [Helianthus debilis subsp. tardiflorus]